MPDLLATCDHCGRDIELIETEFGTEANDQRDYVWTDSPDSRDHVFVCAGCRVAHGIDD